MGIEGKADEVGHGKTQLQETRKRRGRLLFLVFGGAVGLIMLVIGSYQLIEFMDSTDFCGRLCHSVMYPEYTTYEASPHSRVDCVQCHVGSGASYMVKSKASGVPQIIATLFNTYERPIPTPVKDLRPARETCEQCHWPQKFSGDLVRTHVTYLEDEDNTEQVDERIMRVGGGEFASAQDIHWHIGANVWYLPLDKERQDIIWVGVEDADGNMSIYVDPDNADQATSERIRDDKHLMDCVDCHNRATHIFYSPEELIDAALAQGRIDQSLPYIKRESVAVLDPPNPSLDLAMSKVESIEDFYASSYPEVYNEKKDAIDQAIEALKEVARLTTFPVMKVTWETHLDNLGHSGCDRCHGKLVAVAGDQKGETISHNCTMCHYLL